MLKRLIAHRAATQFVVTDATVGGQAAVSRTFDNMPQLVNGLRSLGASEEEIARVRGEFEAGKPATFVDIDDQQNRIRMALGELGKRRRAPVEEPCPRCHVNRWNVDILDLPATSAMSRRPPLPYGANYAYTDQPTGIVSMLSIVCTNCGYTMFHNMGILGV